MERINGCGFDEGLKSLAVITPDNRLRVYDVDLKRLRVECSEKDGLGNRYNCLAWVGPSAVAVGCRNGDVVVYDLQTAEVAHRLRGAGSGGGGVSGLWWCAGQGQLVASSAGGAVTVWDLRGERLVNQLRVGRELSAFAVTPDESLLVTGAFSIRVAATATGQTVVKFPGRHSAAIVRLVPARPLVQGRAPSNIVLSCSATERQLYLWDCTATSQAQAQTEPLQCFVAEAAVVAADVVALDCGDTTTTTTANTTTATATSSNGGVVGTYGVLAVTSTGCVNAWKWRPHVRRKGSKRSNSSSSSSTTTTHGAVLATPQVRIAAAATTEEARAAPIFNASFCSVGVSAGDSAATATTTTTTSATILTARGASTLNPRFDKTVVAFDAPETPATYTLPPMAPAAVSSSSADPNAPTQKKKKTTTTTTTTTNKDGSSSNNNGGVDVLAPHEAGAMEITQSISATSDITTNSSNRHTPKGKDEMTLAERVASEEMGIGGGDNNNNNNEDGAISGSIRANSMHSVLMQAVRTNDQALLDTALYSRSASEQSLAVLSTTVRNLPPQYVVPLLALLVDKFQSAPAHGLVLVQWVKVILTEHLSYLMTIPNIVASLSGLYLMIHSRLETHKTLLKLSGRLDLVLAQVAKAQMGSDAAPPLNIIAEEDDDDDDGNADPKILSVDDDNDDAEDDSDEDMEQITGEAAGYSGDNGNDVDDEEEEEEEVDDENEDDDMDEE